MRCALDLMYENAAWADSFITSPSFPVSFSAPFPGILVDSINNISPPNAVHAKPITTPGVDQEFLKKLDSLLDQNKTISKGIMMMEDRIRNRTKGMQPMMRSPQATKRLPRPLPR